ncbi:MAG: hypothetical protein M1817_003883 [Caeruleum heppii]|nr:MAG: hypothetical protein M1817_003883 [Caeruleum heppii]
MHQSVAVAASPERLHRAETARLPNGAAVNDKDSMPTSSTESPSAHHPPVQGHPSSAPVPAPADEPSRLSPSPERGRKRKRDEETHHPTRYIRAPPSPTRPHSLPTISSGDDRSRPAAVANDGGVDESDPIHHWIRAGTWPKKLFRDDRQTRAALGRPSNRKMNPILARTKSSSSLGRGNTESATNSGVTPSDDNPREEKMAPYHDSRYRALMQGKRSFMSDCPAGIAAASQQLCRRLLETPTALPEDTLFRPDLFAETCSMLDARNEAKVVQDVARLIVPSAQELAIRGATHLRDAIESVNEGWNNSVPFALVRPQPDYSVGFRRSAFTADQLQRLGPFVGQVAEDMSHFLGTWYIYFPFLTSEVKGTAGSLHTADKQNLHNMTLAVRGVVELFQLVGRAQEVDREIVAFSISHNHMTVRIYGHYAVIDGDDPAHITYYRHPIHDFNFQIVDGRERWTAYRFTKNVYDLWMPTHLQRIRSAIDQIPLGVDWGLYRSTAEALAAQSRRLPPPAAEAPGAPPRAASVPSAAESASAGGGAGEDVLAVPSGSTPRTSQTDDAGQPFKRPRTTGEGDGGPR